MIIPEVRLGDMACVDPSVRSAGVAWFRAGVLKAADRITLAADTDLTDATRAFIMGRKCYQWFVDMGAVPRHMVCEWPQIYTLGRSKADPNKLLMMAGVDGAIAGMLALHAAEHNVGFQMYGMQPAEWKAQCTKAVIMARVSERLEGTEKDLITTSHDAMESVGIGLTALGRFERKRVFSAS